VILCGLISENGADAVKEHPVWMPNALTITLHSCVMIIRLTWSLSQWLHAFNTAHAALRKYQLFIATLFRVVGWGRRENIRSKIHCEGSDAFAIETGNITPGAQGIVFQMRPCSGKFLCATLARPKI
jgi:hypothetical protein